MKERMSRRTTEVEEMAKVRQILKEDGYSESDLFFSQALNICTNMLHRRAFLAVPGFGNQRRPAELREGLLGSDDSQDMDSNDDSSDSDTSSEGPDLKNLAKAAVVLRKIKSLLAKQPPVGAIDVSH
ncbi:hypothetical protein ACP70R_000250 [Stipagrostis hirtigluma subsp. patula]